MSYPTTYLVIVTKGRFKNYVGFMDIDQAKRYQKKHGGELIIEKGTDGRKRNR